MTANPSQAPDTQQLQQLDQLRALAHAAPHDPGAQMQLGAALHAAGELEQALVTFERARTLAPDNADAASACAALLFELEQPQAALQVLRSIAPSLMQTADGAANLAIAEEACGHLAEAKAAYARALELDPDHIRSLTNTAVIAARENRWADAVEKAARCVELAGAEPHYWLNLTDMLTGLRDYPAAIGVLEQATAHFPDLPLLRMRLAVVHAFNAAFDQASALMASLGPQAEPLLREYMDLAIAAGGTPEVNRPRSGLPTPQELFAYQAFDAMRQCDWRYHAQLTAVLRDMLAEALRTGKPRDWRDAQFYGLTLPLHEDEVGQIRALTGKAIDKSFMPAVVPYVKQGGPAQDGRMRVGLIVQSLRDPRVANGLARQLSLHDASRFAIHVYAPTPRPEARLVEPLATHAASVTETGHMTIDEVVARIRLDGLDMLMETTFYTPWCRPEIPARRVAPVQICQLSWQRHHPQQSYMYNMSDTFVHPDSADPSRYGVIARLPQTCWLACNDDLPGVAASRADLGLAEDALVLCSFLPAVAIDPDSFALWMQVLRALPEALLMLPGFSGAAQQNLRREARAAGVTDTRLVFTGASSREEFLARMQVADLFIDTLRFNANHGLVDALRLGVPAVTCAGASMASRLGGSIVHAAGLPECVYDDAAAYRDAIVKLGRDRTALQALRSKLAAARPTAPLFDTPRRIREWEAAWAHMIKREQAGLPPASFDIAEAT